MRVAAVVSAFVLAGCVTTPVASPSPVALRVAVRPNCHGANFGRINPHLRIESALAQELSRQFSSSAFAAGDVLEVELNCEPPGATQGSSAMLLAHPLINTPLPPSPRSFQGGLIWICLGQRIGCESDAEIVPQASLNDAHSVAQFIALLLADKMKSDASLLAPGATTK